jgi:hypothetical protein
MNAPLLVSALAITLYFVIGSWFEERKLEVHFGATYREYRKRVPGLIPLPWKHLSVHDSEELMHCARNPIQNIRQS